LPSAGQKATKNRALAIAAAIITTLLVVFLAVCIWLACRRKKRAWRFPDSALDRDGESPSFLFPFNVRPLQLAPELHHINRLIICEDN
jgi:hypothetical protein